MLVVTRTGLSCSEAEQQFAAHILISASRLLQAQGLPKMPCCLLVGMAVHSAFTSSYGVFTRLGIAPRPAVGEVMDQLGEMLGRVRPKLALDGFADPPVDLHPGRDWDLLVDHLADQGVRETVTADRNRFLGDQAQRNGLRKTTEAAVNI